MALSLKEDDVKLMLAAKCHLGTVNVDSNMQHYVFTRRRDGCPVVLPYFAVVCFISLSEKRSS